MDGERTCQTDSRSDLGGELVLGGTSSDAQRSEAPTSDQDVAKKQWNSWLAARWWDFKADVFGREPSIGSVTALLLTLLFGLVAWLTLEFAPGAPVRHELPYGGDPTGVITKEAGYWTIALVTFAALMTGFEHILSRQIMDFWRETGRQWFMLQSIVLRGPILFTTGLISGVLKGLSVVWSVGDYMLARPLAWLVGTHWKGWGKRYGHFTVVMVGTFWLGLYASPPLGAAAVTIGMLAVLAIVRRWNWGERDRETFLIERGKREGALRIGFGQDLRDEALFGVACLFLLVPLGLHQVYLISCADAACAFSFRGGKSLPDAPLDAFGAWLGFFGAELAKTVPFVDWSEVFYVANASPIKAETAVGSITVFLLRVGLDLLLLAAVLQAVQIATRLSEQNRAFHASRLPMLEPFAEARELRKAARGLFAQLGLHTSEQPAIKSFPIYDEGRLKEIAASADGTVETPLRQIAAGLLQSQHGGDQTDAFFSHLTTDHSDPELADWMGRTACAVPPEDVEATDAEKRNQLWVLISDPWADDMMRGAAARAMGRMQPETESVNTLLGLLEDRRLSSGLRADAGLALAKWNVSDAERVLYKIAESFRDSLAANVSHDPNALTAPLVTAFALAHYNKGEEAIVDAFKKSLHEHVLRAASIQRVPMDYAAAQGKERGSHTNQMVALRPGHDPFPKSFRMGSSDDPDDPNFDPQAHPSEHPPRNLTMTRSFAIGRFPVTQGEYLGFCRATGRQPLTYHEQSLWPVFEVTWHDALAYCNWLSRVTGEIFRLPRECEWEYACRAGTQTRFFWGDEWDKSRANSRESGLNRPCDVGSYLPNEFGLFDMTGNIYEWCADPWHGDYEGAPTDDQAWVRGDITRAVVRGGSWDGNPLDLRSAGRYSGNRGSAVSDIGFRLTCTLSR